MEPKRTKADITGERILEASLKAFHKRGYEKTTMRELAEACDLSPGAFYYHFGSKEEIIQVFYERSLKVFDADVDKIVEETTSFEKRLVQACQKRLEAFETSRELLIVLSRAAVDPMSSLSPFTPAQKEIRDATIATMRKLMDGSDLKYDKRLDTYLPSLFWMLMMGFVFYWVFDDSKQQQRTSRLIELLTPQVLRLVRLSRLPLTGSVINPVLKTLQMVFEN